MSGTNIPMVDVDPAKVQRSMSPEQASKYAMSLITDGARLVRDRRATDSYYLTAKLQYSAARGAAYYRVDADLARAIMRSLMSGNSLSKAEIQTNILPRITDAGRYGMGEALLARLLLAATDDRRKVELNDRRVNIDDDGEKALKDGLRSFWGRLGARARWGKDDPCNMYVS